MPTTTPEDAPPLPLNSHVLVVAGEHDGEIGHVTGTGKATAQVSTGNDNVFTVRKTSLRILAHPVAAPAQRTIDSLKIVNFIEQMIGVLNSGPNANHHITLDQWDRISNMVLEKFSEF